MKYSPEQIGKRIKMERLKLNWSQEALGKELGQKSKAKQISKYESGLLPPLDVLLKLCEIFGCELGYLLGEEDYSVGTKLETSIEDLIGLSKESIENLHKLTGTERSCINYGFESENYKRVLNNLLSSELFLSLIQSLFDLEDTITNCPTTKTKLEEKYEKEILDKAFEYYNSTTDYIHDENAEKIPEIYYQVFSDIEEAIDKEYSIQKNNEKDIKVCRYTARETFESLLNTIYPQ